MDVGGPIGGAEASVEGAKVRFGYTLFVMSKARIICWRF